MSGEDDLLERATRALRATPPPSDEELRIERAVLMRAHRAATEKRGGKSRALRWVLPLAAVLTAGSALAATTGQLERAVRAVSAWIEREPATEVRTQKRARPRTARDPSKHLPQPAPLAPQAEPKPSAEAQQAVSPQPPAIVPPKSVEAVRRAAPAPRRQRPDEAPAEEREPAVEQPAPSAGDAALDAPSVAAPNPDLLRYREAHRLHFRERDMWAALKGWESYLSTYPNGTFVIEARYNRAICLVRLGRKDEARRALAPFAAGEIGRGYREAEASELLKALE